MHLTLNVYLTLRIALTVSPTLSVLRENLRTKIRKFLELADLPSGFPLHLREIEWGLGFTSVRRGAGR